MADGYLAVVLHAHLPYLRHPEGGEHLEERWFFEAVTGCYLPLLKVLEKLIADGVDFRLAISLSPPLLAMLADPLLTERYEKYLDSLVELGEKEVRRTARQPDFHRLALFYLENFLQARKAFLEDYGRSILNGLRKLGASGKVELITTAATHGYLPLMSAEEAQRAQVGTGLSSFASFFGFRPAGFWLPECGYASGLERILAENDLRYFFTEAHCLLNSRPKARFGIFMPVFCGRQVAAFARDPQSSRQVWDRQVGYPGDFVYREFYRDIGYDLGLDYLGPYLPGGNIRVDTGFKYYRITTRGPLHEKEPYRPEEARARAAEHAADFVLRKREQVFRLKREVPVPVVVAPYDAELFGHWWYEGPQWLDFLCREASRQNDFRLVTPSEYLALRPELQTVELSPGSWGEGGYNYVWLNGANDWLYRHLHRAEAKMSELADLAADAAGLEERALNQAARELLLAQSSDWAFIMKTGTAVEYARYRFVSHLRNFNELVGQVERQKVEEGFVSRLEQAGGAFPVLDFRVFSRHARTGLKNLSSGAFSGDRRYRVLILSWEYPPATVGGLARHVHDLAHALAGYGDEVHVLTCPYGEQGTYFFDRGVHVHRVPPEELTAQDFFSWVEELNSSLVALGRRVAEAAGPFDLVHGHDWLVERSATELREILRVPFLATIHATEHGRNQGIHTDLQRRIHLLEKKLANGADLVIACSTYMAEEVKKLFGVSPDKIRVIPNGVDPENLARKRGFGADCRPGPSRREKGARPLVLFFGRLVPEKGVQVLLEAMPAVAGRVPGVRLKVAGKGPYEEYLRDLACRLKVAERVEFVGYVDDQERNRLLREGWAAAFPSLYEPFGIVALEAMAAGVPVVVSDTGGLGDIVEHGVDGYKVPPGKSDLLAYYLSELLANPLLAEELCRQAWRKVLTLYDWRYIAAATREVYGELAG
ncbi:MAG: 1,4-alpha-glucan branching protein domain-containing protein [Desulfotomaculales bacterium]